MSRRIPTCAIAVLLLALPAPARADGRTVVVGPADDLRSALASAGDGDTVVVASGVHRGPLVLARRVALVGLGSPVLDGGGHGTVVKVVAEGASLRGFVVLGSGESLDEENSGVTVEAAGVIVEDNQILDCLFGVTLAKAARGVVRGNLIVGKDLPEPRRGDGIRVWYSDDVTVADNVVWRGRDCVLWYSQRLKVTRNVGFEGRYGLHFMFCDDCDIEQNRLIGNSVGAFLMYSRRLRLVRNVALRNRGPSGYAVGLKDMDACLLEDNVFADNRVGLYVDNSPTEGSTELTVRGNLIAGNDSGVRLTPSVRWNRYVDNSFVDNGEQVGIQGGGRLEGNHWSSGGRGNFWSDYVGYDADEDGIGDVGYRSDRLFEVLTDRRPALRLFIGGAAAGAIEMAARAVPLVRPQPKLVDDAPLLRPRVPAGVPSGRGSRRRGSC